MSTMTIGDFEITVYRKEGTFTIIRNYNADTYVEIRGHTEHVYQLEYAVQELKRRLGMSQEGR